MLPGLEDFHQGKPSVGCGSPPSLGAWKVQTALAQLGGPKTKKIDPSVTKDSISARLVLQVIVAVGNDHWNEHANFKV